MFCGGGSPRASWKLGPPLPCPLRKHGQLSPNNISFLHMVPLGDLWQHYIWGRVHEALGTLNKTFVSNLRRPVPVTINCNHHPLFWHIILSMCQLFQLRKQTFWKTGVAIRTTPNIVYIFTTIVFPLFLLLHRTVLLRLNQFWKKEEVWVMHYANV